MQDKDTEALYETAALPPGTTAVFYPGGFAHEFISKVQMICPSLRLWGSRGGLSIPAPVRQQSGRTPAEGAKPPGSALSASAGIPPGQSGSGSPEPPRGER